jgi:hypothetical protein
VEPSVSVKKHTQKSKQHKAHPNSN